MEIKNITTKQAIEIAKLLYPFDEFIKSEMIVKYFDGNYGKFIKFEDIDITISFDFQMFPHTDIGKMIIKIFPNLDCSIGCYINHKFVKSYPVRNQFLIQNKFKEWNIYPIMK